MHLRPAFCGYKKSGTVDLHSGHFYSVHFMKELSFFRISFDWTHSSRCFVPYKSSFKSHTLNTSFPIEHVSYDLCKYNIKPWDSPFLLYFKEKLFFPWESPFSFEVTDKSKHFTSWESPEIVTWEISILCKGNYVPEISCRHRTKLNICCQFK